MGIELFFGFYFLGGGDFPGRVKCLPITRRFKADADKVFGWVVFRGFILLLLRNNNSCAA